MKRYLLCLLIMTVILGLSCASAPTTPAPTQSATPQQTAAATPPASTPPPAPVVPATPQLTAGLDMSGASEYTIIPGDFLSEITRRFYGDLTDVGPAGRRNGFYFPVLMLASEGQITDPDLIYAGAKLKIPVLKINLENPDSRRAIKNILLQVALLYRDKNLPDEAEGLQRLADSL